MTRDSISLLYIIISLICAVFLSICLSPQVYSQPSQEKEETVPPKTTLQSDKKTDRNQSSSDGLYIITLILRSPVPLSPQYTSRWETVAKSTKSDAPYLIFLAETLTILDNGSNANFSVVDYTEYDMFGGCDREWTIATKKARIFRNNRQEIRESWSSLRVDVDNTEISGIPEGRYITWNGDVGSGLEIGNITDEMKKSILKVAYELYKDVSCESKEAPPHSRLRSSLLMGEKRSENPPPDEIKGLILLVGDQENDVSVAALKRLGEYKLLGDPNVKKAVTDAILHGKAPVQRCAVRLPGEARDKSYLPVLIKALKDGDSSVEEGAVDSLRQIGDTAAVPHLLNMLKSTLDYVRHKAIIAIGELRQPEQSREIIRNLMPYLTDESQYVREITVNVLSRYHDPRLVAPFIKCLKDNFEWVRMESARALGAWGARDAVPALITALSDSDNGVVFEVVKALGEIGDQQALKPVSERLEREKGRGAEGDTRVMEAAEKAIEAIKSSGK